MRRRFLRAGARSRTRCVMCETRAVWAGAPAAIGGGAVGGSSSGSGFRDKSLGLWDRMAAGWGRDGDSIGRRRAPWASGWLPRSARAPGHSPRACGRSWRHWLRGREFGRRLGAADLYGLRARDGRGRARSRRRAGADERRVSGARRGEHRVDCESVDCVLCRWGYMLMENPALALRETRRVLRPGGRLALSVWGAPADNAWASIPDRGARRRWLA